MVFVKEGNALTKHLTEESLMQIEGTSVNENLLQPH